MACMRACPTHAIRVKNGKAILLPELCIDCGSCLRACPSGAISATTHFLKEFGNFKFKVAVPSPVLFGQFPAPISPSDIVAGLEAIGFDAVWVMAAETDLMNRAVRNYMKTWKGRLPLISSSCPVIVRLIQVAYPAMVEQLLHLQPPRELAGRELKRRYSEALKIDKEEIGAIYLTCCQAKSISILEPAEGEKSNLDGSIGIADLYNDILAATQPMKRPNNSKTSVRDLLRSINVVNWGLGEGHRWNLQDYRYMVLTGLSNVIRVFDDIEKGKIRDLDFLECYACWGGCSNGNLTVENLYLTRSRLYNLMPELQGKDPRLEEEVEERYAKEEFYLKAPIRPRSIRGDKGDLRERVKRIKLAEEMLSTLPGLNCGLCGTPSCKTLANDIASGDAERSQCIFYSRDRLESLREIYLKNTP
jgi:iron only hydrogenase large subunit-like protein